jgi:hypothetical protein
MDWRGSITVGRPSLGGISVDEGKRTGGVWCCIFQAEGFRAGVMSSRGATLYICRWRVQERGGVPRCPRVARCAQGVARCAQGVQGVWCDGESVARGTGEGTPLRRGTNKNLKADQSESESCAA